MSDLPVTQLCEVRSFWDLVVVSAMVGDGQLGSPARRVLVVANCGDVPEGGRRVQDNPSFGRLAAGFDEVIDYNAAVHPLHPGLWRPQRFEEPLWERAFRALWGLGDGPVEVVAETVQSPPGLTLGLVFADARVRAYYDDLWAARVVPRPLPVRLGARLDCLLHLDFNRGRPPRPLVDRPVPVMKVGAASVRRAHQEAGASLPQRLAWDPAVGLPRVRGNRLHRLVRALKSAARESGSH